jgi:hypothetical protein
MLGRDPDAAPGRRPDLALTLGNLRYARTAAGDRIRLDLPGLDLPVLDLRGPGVAVLVRDQAQQPQARVPVQGRVMGVEDQGVPAGPAGEQQPERR